MTITFTIPDDKINRIRDAFCTEFSYQDTITNQDGTTSPNPQTKLQFTKAQIVDYIKQVTRNYEGRIAENTARTTINNDVNSISIT